VAREGICDFFSFVYLYMNVYNKGIKESKSGKRKRVSLYQIAFGLLENFLIRISNYVGTE